MLKNITLPLFKANDAAKLDSNLTMVNIWQDAMNVGQVLTQMLPLSMKPMETLPGLNGTLRLSEIRLP